MVQPEQQHLFGEGALDVSLRKAEKRVQEAPPELRSKLYDRISQARLQIIRAAIPKEKVIVERQPGDILGKVQNEFAYIDPVAFKDPQELLHVLVHEKIHLEGIENDGLAELIVEKLTGIPGTQSYSKEIANMRRVTELLGVDAVESMYKDGDFHMLLARFKAAYFGRLRKKPAQVTPDDHRWTEKIFQKAFPELEILRQREFSFSGERSEH